MGIPAEDEAAERARHTDELELPGKDLLDRRRGMAVDRRLELGERTVVGLPQPGPPQRLGVKGDIGRIGMGPVWIARPADRQGPGRRRPPLPVDRQEVDWPWGS